jgi:DHA1 family multidrug resistance protein-like MFS transporter/DHA1 family quinolone resistance protein-like MFS transporter
VTLNIITKKTPADKMGSRLGVYEALFGVGWTAGPITVGLSSDAFGSSSPYLAFFVIGTILAAGITVIGKKKR